MTSSWSAKAESASTVVLWLGSLMAVLITVLWISRNVYPAQIATTQLNDDLERLQNDFSDACNSLQFNRTFNPVTEKGELSIENQRVCMTSSSYSNCRDLICETGISRTIDLDTLIVMRIVKDQNFSVELVT